MLVYSSKLWLFALAVFPYHTVWWYHKQKAQWVESTHFICLTQTAHTLALAKLYNPSFSTWHRNIIFDSLLLHYNHIRSNSNLKNIECHRMQWKKWGDCGSRWVYWSFSHHIHKIFWFNGIQDWIVRHAHLWVKQRHFGRIPTPCKRE